MSVKTITIDMEAYTLLSRAKKASQSFSQVIKEHFGPEPTAGRFLARIRSIRIGEDALNAMDRQVQSRSRHPARAAGL